MWDLLLVGLILGQEEQVWEGFYSIGVFWGDFLFFYCHWGYISLQINTVKYRQKLVKLDRIKLPYISFYKNIRLTSGMGRKPAPLIYLQVLLVLCNYYYSYVIVKPYWILNELCRMNKALSFDSTKSAC